MFDECGVFVCKLFTEPSPHLVLVSVGLGSVVIQLHYDIRVAV